MGIYLNPGNEGFRTAIRSEIYVDKTGLIIKDRHYTQALEGYSGEILLVGINYDKDSVNKPHTCRIERFIM